MNQVAMQSGVANVSAILGLPFVVETFTFCDGWVNTSTVYDETGDAAPAEFATLGEAHADIQEHMEDLMRAYQCGDISDEPTVTDYRIVNKLTGSEHYAAWDETRTNVILV